MDENTLSHKQRIRFIDYFKALLMILVVMGHINYANSGIKEWIYSFHMPAFFFVSGIMLSFSYSTNPKAVFSKYIDRLVVPFFLWALVFAKFSFPNLLRIVYASYSSISHAGALTSLWFLPVMFWAVLLLFFFERCFKGKSMIWLKALCVIVAFAIGFILPPIKYGYPWSINVTLVAFGFMLLGRILKEVIFAFENGCDNKRVRGIIICILSISICLAATFIYRYNIPSKGFVLMGNARYGNPFLFVLSSFFGILFILFLSILIDLIMKGKDIKVLSFIGQNTLCIFAVQKPIIQAIGYLNHYIQLPSTVVLIVATVGTLIIACIACWFFNNYLPVFVGKEKVFFTQNS